MYSDGRWWKTNDEPLLYKEEYRELLMCMEGLDVKWVRLFSCDFASFYISIRGSDGLICDFYLGL